LIDTENLTKKFGKLTAVEDLTLHVDEGEVFGFLGPNGAGKTTTMRMLCCLIQKTSGEARIGDYEVSSPADAVKIRRIIGVLPENVGLYEELSAYQNLDYYGRLFKLTRERRAERIEYFLRMLGLWETRDQLAGSLSKGMKQKLAIARALIHDPKVLFLDEPTANLDPEASRTVLDFILELKKEKRTIFLNTHFLDEADRICDRVGILKTRLLTTNSPLELRRSLWGRKTVIQVERVNDAIVSAVRGVEHGSVQVEGNRFIVEVSDPERENPELVNAIDRAGGRVQYVNDVIPTLEDVYLKLVRG
jgi:ABC-2 type transport system ATP-binding protein